MHTYEGFVLSCNSYFLIYSVTYLRIVGIGSSSPLLKIKLKMNNTKF